MSVFEKFKEELSRKENFYSSLTNKKLVTKNMDMFVTLFRMGFFGAVHGWGPKKTPLPKICHTYPTMMKLDTVIH